MCLLKTKNANEIYAVDPSNNDKNNVLPGLKHLLTPSQLSPGLERTEFNHYVYFSFSNPLSRCAIETLEISSRLKNPNWILADQNSEGVLQECTP
jgi:hypothetical protein